MRALKIFLVILGSGVTLAVVVSILTLAQKLVSEASDGSVFMGFLAFLILGSVFLTAFVLIAPKVFKSIEEKL